VRWQNEGSFGCEVIACALGQPNVPECAMAINQIILSVFAANFPICLVFFACAQRPGV